MEPPFSPYRFSSGGLNKRNWGRRTKMLQFAPYKIPKFLKPLLEEQAKIGRYKLHWKGADSDYLDRGFGLSAFNDIPCGYDTPKEYMERKKRYEEIEEEIEKAQEEHGEWYKDQFKDSGTELFKRVLKEMQQETYATEEEQILAKSNRKKDAEKQYNLARYYENKEGKDWRENRIYRDKSFFFDMKAAKNGNAESQFKLAEYFLTSSDIKRDEKTGMLWLQKAAEQGLSEAEQFLGRIIGRTRDKDNYKRAVYWMEQAANQGNASAQHELADFFKEGIVVRKNIKRALYWERKAADQGNAHASSELAKYYYNKKNKDTEQALYWYKKAAEQGTGFAAEEYSGFGSDFISFVAGSFFVELAEFYEKENYAEEIVVQHYKKAIELEYSEAKYKLAQYYDKIGNKEEALRWFEAAAESGDEGAVYALAQYYEHETDEDEKAIYWYEKAMKMRQNLAGYKLAQYYELLAFTCCEKAANAGNVEAKFKLAQYAEINAGYLFRKSEVLEYYIDAGIKGHVEAQYKVAECFEKGYDNDNGKENKERAFAWYLTAAENGHRNAQLRIAKCYETGYGTDKNKEKADSWYKIAAKNKKEKKVIYYQRATEKKKDDSVIQLEILGLTKKNWELMDL